MPEKVIIFWQKSTIARSLATLPRRDQFKIFVIAVLQIISGFLDLLGVALIGILGSYSNCSREQYGWKPQEFY